MEPSGPVATYRGDPRLTAVATPGIPLPLLSCGRPPMMAARPVRPRAPVAVADGGADGEVAGAVVAATGADDAGTTGTALVVGLTDVDCDSTGDGVGFAAGGVDLCEL